jgi:transposase
MEREALAAQLAQGRSIEAIARDCGRAASTVAYWVNKHGLTSAHAARHAPRGGIERERLAALVEEGLSIRAMAERLEVSYTTVRHWLKTYAIRTPRAVAWRKPRPPGPAEPRRPWRTAPITAGPRSSGEEVTGSAVNCAAQVRSNDGAAKSSGSSSKRRAVRACCAATTARCPVCTFITSTRRTRHSAFRAKA